MNPCSYNPDGPAVLVATASSIFPLEQAKYLLSQGIPVVIVSREARIDTVTDEGVRILSVRFRQPLIIKFLKKFYPVFRLCEALLVQMYKGHYRKATGRREPDPWEPHFVANFLESFGVTKVAKSLSPRFVFAHEVGSYGLAAARCSGIPKFVMPWGADVFLSSETSPVFYKLIAYALKNVDLVFPSSVTAASHICDRFRIPNDKVVPISWGADLSLFKRASACQRKRILERYGIPRDATIIANPRRFMPAWGCFAALEAFIELSHQYPQLHFIMLGGKDASEHIQKAVRVLEAKGLSQRFLIFKKDVPISTFAEVMSVSDIFVSLLGRGDMRSSSVLQAAASGAVPVITDAPEYRAMEKNGFTARFMERNDVECTIQGIKDYLEHPEKVAAARDANESYLREHEDCKVQMARMMDIIKQISKNYQRP